VALMKKGTNFMILYASTQLRLLANKHHERLLIDARCFSHGRNGDLSKNALIPLAGWRRRGMIPATDFLMTLPITGGCLCGAVRYEVSAEPMLMAKCHCRDCQRITGGAYVPALIFPYPAFRLTAGELQRHVTQSETGGENVRGFCAKCGSRLTGVENPERGIIGVVAASLDDPSIFQPRFDIYVEDAQAWDIMDPAIPKFPKMMPQGS
jgi:hypothetical protein